MDKDMQRGGAIAFSLLGSWNHLWCSRHFCLWFQADRNTGKSTDRSRWEWRLWFHRDNSIATETRGERENKI